MWAEKECLEHEYHDLRKHSLDNVVFLEIFK